MANGAPIEGTVDLWSAPLDVRRAGAPDADLSPDERARAARFLAPRDRERFVAGRSFLRRVLARYAGSSPILLRFAYGPQGKPALDDPPVDLTFNLAHSADLAVCAIARAAAIGIDVERVAPLREMDGVRRLLLSAGERDALDRLPEDRQLRRLYEIWVCKEAVLKAWGTGLDRPLDRLVIAFPESSPPCLAGADDMDPLPLSLRLFEPVAGFVGALAVAGRLDHVRQLSWQWS